MIKKIVINLHVWVRKNIEKLFIVAFIYGITSYVLTLPYINLIKIIISSFPVIVTWIAIVKLFHPKKEYILKCAFILVFLAFLFALINMQNVCSGLGDIIYLLIATYILSSLKEYRL